ncbi:MAG: M20/M25/M40 family metallo-hydrolase [Gammaproteobacteria bacterium]|nr:M20/M25/M40 family metallo-hydrolase [Gammaproteobacteria bacterium]
MAAYSVIAIRPGIQFMQKRLFSILSILIMISSVVVIRTLLHSPPPFADITLVNIDLDEPAMADRLSQAIRFQTISHQSASDKQNLEFQGFIDWVEVTYPAVHSKLDRVMLGQTILYQWQGSVDHLKPILLTGHYDVVPVIPGSEHKWLHPPFAGKVVDGDIWGRGALDDKSGVVGILEAVTYLLNDGFQPRRSIYLSFGHDEEVGGVQGAAAVADYLKKNKEQLAWSLDEGSFLYQDMLPDVDTLVAAINVAEKGSITLDIVATAEGGHSSMPPQQNAVSDLAKAITLLHENPVPGGLEGLSAEMFDVISRYMAFPTRLLFANQWLFSQMIEQQLSTSPTTNAMLRTTTAPTMLSGSIKSNVLPIEAIATVNFRIHPRDNTTSIEKFVNDLVASDSITVRKRSGINASAVSARKTPAFEQIGQSMREVYGDIAVAPGLMIAGSDSKHYAKVADNAYRFNPFILPSADISGFHGSNEKIAVAAFAQGVREYIQIIRNGSSQ